VLHGTAPRRHSVPCIPSRLRGRPPGPPMTDKAGHPHHFARLSRPMIMVSAALTMLFAGWCHTNQHHSSVEGAATVGRTGHGPRATGHGPRQQYLGMPRGPARVPGWPSLVWYVRRCPTLPRGLPRSTIGAEGLNFRVRNGTGCFPFAVTAETLWRCNRFFSGRVSGTAQWTRVIMSVCQASRPISTGQLRTLPCFHFRPINPVV
jgi:hypothetical protein